MGHAICVVIPTYNGNPRITRLLDSLASQDGIFLPNLDVLVVDNNSTDGTGLLMQNLIDQRPYPYNLRYTTEPRQGVHWARTKGVAETTAEFIALLDDDLEVAPNWIQEATRFGMDHQNAGAWGSRILLGPDINPPKGFHLIAGFYAITTWRDERPRLLRAGLGKLLLPAAGLVVRRSAWKSSIPKNFHLVGRTVSSPLTGEDIEMQIYLQRNGWEIWYNPAMRLIHYLCSSRLRADKLALHMYGIGLSRVVTRALLVPLWLRPLLLPACFLLDLARLILHLANPCPSHVDPAIYKARTSYFMGCLRGPLEWIARMINRPDHHREAGTKREVIE